MDIRPNIYLGTPGHFMVLHQDGVGPFVLLGNALGHPYGLWLGDSTRPVIYEEDPLVCFIGVRDWSLGEGCNEEEVENTARDHLKCERRTTRGPISTGLLDTVRLVSMPS